MPFQRSTESSINLVERWSSYDATSDNSKSSAQNGVFRTRFEPELTTDDEDADVPQVCEVVGDVVESDTRDNREDFGRFKTCLTRVFPPRGPGAKWITWGILFLLLFGMTWSLAPNYMQPGQNVFGLLITILLCFIAEDLIARIPMCDGAPPLPKLLASLLTGLTLANLPDPVNVAFYIDPQWSWTLRTLALAVILTRAGLELDPKAMERVKWAVVRLAFLPCLGETLMIGVFGHLIMGFPWIWSLMLGFLIAAVSPAVVIPSLILLQERGLGVAKGVPSLVMAASGIDDVLAIAGFTVLLGIAMPSKLEEDIIGSESRQLHPRGVPSFRILLENSTIDNATISYTPVSFGDSSTATQVVLGESHNKVGLELLGALVEVAIGLMAGLACGFFLSYIPHSDMKYKNFCRGSLLLGTGIFAVFATDFWGIPGSGALWALVTSFVASLHWKEECKPLEHAWHYMWIVFQPILFGLTGATVQVSMLDGETVGLGLAVLVLGLVARMFVSTSVTWGLGFNLREKAFVSIAWLPKGTVQAALGSAALDTAIALQRSSDEIRWAEQILVLAVLVTLLTAPAGAFGISLSGPKLLESTQKEGEEEDNEAYDISEESQDRTPTDMKRRISSVEIENEEHASNGNIALDSCCVTGI